MLAGANHLLVPGVVAANVVPRGGPDEVRVLHVVHESLFHAAQEGHGPGVRVAEDEAVPAELFGQVIGGLEDRFILGRDPFLLGKIGEGIDLVLQRRVFHADELITEFRHLEDPPGLVFPDLVADLANLGRLVIPGGQERGLLVGNHVAQVDLPVEVDGVLLEALGDLVAAAFPEGDLLGDAVAGERRPSDDLADGIAVHEVEAQGDTIGGLEGQGLLDAVNAVHGLLLCYAFHYDRRGPSRQSTTAVSPARFHCTIAPALGEGDAAAKAGVGGRHEGNSLSVGLDRKL